MEFKLANILVFIGLGVGFLVMTLTVGWLLRPKVDEESKLGIYECGETPIHQAWFNFNPRFYIVALVFLIFDVEVYPAPPLDSNYGASFLPVPARQPHSTDTSESIAPPQREEGLVQPQ